MKTETKRPTCGPLYLEALSKHGKTPEAYNAFVVGFISGQAEKVYLGACLAAMFRPDAARWNLVVAYLTDVCGRYGLMYRHMRHELWICRPENLDAVAGMDTFEVNSPQWHDYRGLLCGVPATERDPEFHTRPGFDENASEISPETSPVTEIPGGPSRRWLLEMAEAEESVRSISVGGMAADVGLLNDPTQHESSDQARRLIELEKALGDSEQERLRINEAIWDQANQLRLRAEKAETELEEARKSLARDVRLRAECHKEAEANEAKIEKLRTALEASESARDAINSSLTQRQDEDRRRLRLISDMYYVAGQIAGGNELEAVKKLKADCEDWRRVVIECGKILHVEGTPDSGRSSNLPNIVRDLRVNRDTAIAALGQTLTFREFSDTGHDANDRAVASFRAMRDKALKLVPLATAPSGVTAVEPKVWWIATSDGKFGYASTDEERHRSHYNGSKIFRAVEDIAATDTSKPS